MPLLLGALGQTTLCTLQLEFSSRSHASSCRTLITTSVPAQGGPCTWATTVGSLWELPVWPCLLTRLWHLRPGGDVGSGQLLCKGVTDCMQSEGPPPLRFLIFSTSDFSQGDTPTQSLPCPGHQPGSLSLKSCLREFILLRFTHLGSWCATGSAVLGPVPVQR